MSKVSSVLYLDTSILIASFVHPPAIKQHIRAVLSSYDVLVSGLIAKQEFSRRLLKEAHYLLSQLKRRNYSFRAVYDHVVSSLPPQMARKQKICLQILGQCFEEDSDSDKGERLLFFLEDLLENGIAELEDSGVVFVKNSKCQNGLSGYVLKKDRWRFAGNDCPGNCQVGQFLYACDFRNTLMHALTQHELTSELQKSLKFLGQLNEGCSNAIDFNPCLTVGDLIIAMECKVAGAEDFFTQNFKESRILCPALGLRLITCPTNQDKVVGE